MNFIYNLKGAHLNMAVSFAMLILGRMSILRFFVYSIAQFIGAFLGALVTFVVYIDVLKSYGGNMYSIDTAGIFATYPSPLVSSFGGFFDQVIGTAILLIVILAITDKKNGKLSLSLLI
jgi:glycerol uptake facilitator-like aquaporin